MVFYVEDHVICKQNFTSSFPVWFLLFFLFSDCCGKTSKATLNSSGESGHPCLVPNFRGNAFSFLPLRIMFDVGLSYMVFITLRYVPSMPAFWTFLIVTGC